MLYNLVAIFIGGGLGSIARFGLARWAQSFTTLAFPLGTLAVNISSCFILGMVAGMAGGKGMLNPNLRFLVAIGFCGGFSTFSAFSFETFELIRAGNFLYAVSNIVANVVLCMLAFGGGMYLLKNL